MSKDKWARTLDISLGVILVPIVPFELWITAGLMEYPNFSFDIENLIWFSPVFIIIFLQIVGVVAFLSVGGFKKLWKESSDSDGPGTEM